ncbi:MAG: hypothetical protein IKQ62_09830 [Bacteroidaceae bacterium]|nr:hypothetical protein [Bacteroidaceae bacterium]
MEKKRYVAPLVEHFEMDNVLPVCVSPGVTGGGMGYGGVDKEGGKDPGAQQRIIEDMEAGNSEELW